MARVVKQWFDEVGSGTDLEAPTVEDQTIVDAAALRDMEMRDGTYVDTQIAGVFAKAVVINHGDALPSTSAYPAGTLLLILPG